MNLFDPTRQKTMSDHPQLIDSVDAVPIMYIDPVTSTDVELSAWVRTRDGSGHVCRSRVVCVADLGSFMAEFIADPESVLKRDFDWTPHRTPARRDDPNTAQPVGRPREAPKGPVEPIDI